MSLHIRLYSLRDLSPAWNISLEPNLILSSFIRAQNTLGHLKIPDGEVVHKGSIRVSAVELAHSIAHCQQSWCFYHS